MSFYREAFLTATHLINLLPSPVIGNISPYQKLFNKAPDYTLLEILVLGYLGLGSVGLNLGLGVDWRT